MMMKTLNNNPNSTHSVLMQRGFSPELVLQVRKSLSTAEKGKKYVLNISGNKLSELFQVDGNIVTAKEKCDKLILVQLKKEQNAEEWAEIMVELKGKGVKHAWEQLLATARNPLFYHVSNIQRRACVVAAGFPVNNSNPEVERLKNELIKIGFKPVSRKSNQPDSI